jgi:transcriptional regulator with XRE-family HTH domain
VKTPGELLREARAKHGVSQKRLAMRASTTQSAISRIERDRISPSVETVQLAAKRRDSGIDWTLNAKNLALTPAERVRQGLAFAEFVRRNRGSAVRGAAA